MSQAPVVGLFHGSFHCEDHFEPFRTVLLEDFGCDSIAVNFPATNPEATLFDYADIAVQAMCGVKDIILFSHSRGANVALRAAGRLSVSKIVFLAPSFDVSSLAALQLTDDEIASLPAKYQPGFQEGLIDLGNHMMRIPHDHAIRHFYNYCHPKTQQWAASLLRDQRRSPHEPPLAEWPRIPMDFVLPMDDQTANPDYNIGVIGKLLQLGYPVRDIYTLKADHSPFLSAPWTIARRMLGKEVSHD